MAEQLDVRSLMSLLRRRRRWLAAIACIGALLGVALVTWHPPLYTSTSKVLLPEQPVQTAGEDASWEASTQVSIAESDAVLGPAAKAVTPQLSRREVRNRVSVSAPSARVLVISAQGSTGASAMALARAVAESEVEYQAQAASSLSAAELSELSERRDRLQSTLHAVDEQIAKAKDRLDNENEDSSVGRRDASALTQLTAQQTDLVLDINELETKLGKATGTSSVRILEDATPAERPQLILWYLAAGVVAMLLVVMIAIIVMTNLARRDAQLGTRDEIADAVGSEVLASLRSHLPHTVAAWRSLLESYSPNVAEGWAVRLALAGLGLDELAMGRPEAQVGEAPRVRRQLCVLSLEEDTRALAVGPQVASYAASIGISTRLIPEQNEATAGLWAACSSSAGDEQVRPNLTVASRRRTKRQAELTVIVTVLDRRSPRMPRLSHTATVVLAVSPRAASSEDLARAALVAYEAGFRISGIFVADPDPLDKTTGRLLPHERLQQPPLPSRVSAPRPVALRDSSWTGGAS